MKDLIEALRRFFLVLFGGNIDDMDRRKRLREIQNQLRNSSPSIYDPSSGKVLPAFAQVLGRLARALRPIDHIFNRTIFSEDGKSADRYWDYLFEERLPEQLLSLREGLRYEEMKNQILSTSDPEAEIRQYQSSFEDLLKTASEANYPEFNAGCRELDLLGHLCRYDFLRLLRHFDDNYDLWEQNYQPVFHPVDGTDILPELMDLYYVTGALQLTNLATENVILLLERLYREKAESHESKIIKVLSLIRNVLDGHLNNDILVNLIRAVENDPDLQPKRDRSQRNYLEDYSQRLEERYSRDLDSIKREVEKGLLEMDLSLLFGNAELLEIESYNEVLNTKLFESEYRSFTKIIPFQIVKSFLYMKFEKDLKDLLKKILVDGIFEDKAFQDELSSTLYDCETAKDLIAGFEADLTDEEEGAVVELTGLMQKHQQGRNVIPAINNQITAIDEKAGEHIESITNHFFRLSKQLEGLVSDSRSRNPAHVSNIKVLGGGKHLDLLKLLKDRLKDTERFIAIMKNFTIIQTPDLGANESEREQPE
jgi:hypothetical protein